MLAATNKDLTNEIRAGRFREDLYFRLNVIPIAVPPLRTRDSDIPLLADHFMAELAREHGRRPKRFDAGALTGLRSYPWPGNVRELRNVIERLIIMVPGDTITCEGPGVSRRPRWSQSAGKPGRVGAAARGARRLRARSTSSRHWRRSRETSRTADVLGVERSNLYRKMRGFGIAPTRETIE